MLDFDIWRMSAISRTVLRGLASINVFILSLLILIGRSERDVSSIEKFAERNFADYFWHTCSFTASSPYTAHIFLCLCCVFAFFKIRKHNVLKMLIFVIHFYCRQTYKTQSISLGFFSNARWNVIYQTIMRFQDLNWR